MSPTKRTTGWLVLGAISLAFLLLASCAPKPQTPAAEPSPGPAAPEPKYGGIFVNAATSAPLNLHPLQGTGTDQRQGMGPAYETLVSFELPEDKNYDADPVVVPWLAARWEQPNDTTYVFHLNKGVKWHDGVEFTADDVVFTYEYLRDPKNAFRQGTYIRQVLNTIEALDKYTVKLTTKTTAPYLLPNLAEMGVVILPKHVFDRGGDFAKILVGTGAFKLKSADLSKENVFVRFEDYWQKGRPYLDGVRVVFGLDQPARIAAIIAKNTDWTVLVDKAQFEPIKAVRPDIKQRVSVIPYGNALYPKLDRPPFNDIRVRQAVHLAVDRQAMIKTLTFGEGVINPPGFPGNKVSWVLPQEELLKLPGYRQPKDQDIAEAKRLLNEAGYPNGFKVTVRFGAGATTPKIIEMFAGQMKTIGIDMSIEGLQMADFREKEARGDYEAIMTMTAQMDETRKQYDYLPSTGPVNKVGLKDEKLDELLERMLVTPELAKRQQIALEIQRLLLDKLYIIPTIELASYVVFQPWVYMPRADSAVAIVDVLTASKTWLDVDKLPPERR